MPNIRHGADAAGKLGPKERIFHAAMTVAMQKGFGKVTLDLIATEAGLSKGGLLHHFATKNDLIGRMLEFYADPATRHARPGEANASSCCCNPFAVAVLIAAAENPSLLEAIHMPAGWERSGPEDRPDPMSCLLRLIGDPIAKLELAGQAKRNAA